jgi:hypothetical protein
MIAPQHGTSVIYFPNASFCKNSGTERINEWNLETPNVIFVEGAVAPNQGPKTEPRPDPKWMTKKTGSQSKRKGKTMIIV